MSYSTSGTISEVLIGTGVLYIKDASTTSLVFRVMIVVTLKTLQL